MAAPEYGEVTGVTETRPWDIAGSQHGYGVNYTCSGMAERATTTYTTDNGVTKWGYADYHPYGFAGGGGITRQPQTMRLLDSGGNPTPEEFHYQYDSGGRLLGAGFAMTPAAGYTPP